MKVAKKIIGGVAGLAVVAGALIGYQEVRKAAAFQVCEGIGSQPTLENIEKMENCVRSLKKIPFLGERGKEELARVEGLLPLLRTLATLNEGATEAVSETKTEAVEEVANQKPAVATMSATPVAPAPTPVSFDTLSPCDQLDAIAKAGKSVSEFLVAAAKVGDFKKYETAISAICPWNAEQLAVANRVLHPPVIAVQPRVVSRSVPAPAPAPAPQPRLWNQGGPRIVPAEEAWCYSSNPLDCPRNQNGNPWDNDLPELPRNSKKSETFEPLLHEGEF